MNRTIFSSALAVAALGLIATAANAASTTYYVSSLSNAPGSIAGFDPDKPAPTVTPNGFYATGGVGDYNSVRFAPGSIGLSGLTLGQIASISYDHLQASGLDWQLKVYTVDQDGAGPAWYGVRLNYDLSTGTGAWSTFTDTNATAERIKPFGQPDIYQVNNPSGFAAALAAAANQQVLFFDISAGANSGGYPYNTFLNNIAITTTGGDTSILAVAVPLPTAAMSSGALLALTALRRRR